MTNVMSDRIQKTFRGFPTDFMATYSITAGKGDGSPKDEYVLRVISWIWELG